MQSFLVIGSTEEKRLEKVEELIGKKISFQKNNPDFILLAMAEKSISIDEIRNLQKKLILKPFIEREKICLVKEAQNLTTEAQNALLKTLEEPPPDCLIVLSTPNTNLLLPTIISRCQIVNLGRVNQILIDKEEIAKISELWEKILDSTPGKRLKIIEEEGIGKERSAALEWFDKLTIAIRNILIVSFPPSSDIWISQYLEILSQISLAKKYLNANCNVKLVIDNFLLDLPSENR